MLCSNKEEIMKNKEKPRRDDRPGRVVMEIPMGHVPLLDKKGESPLKLQLTEKGNAFISVPAGRSEEGKYLSHRFWVQGIDALYSEEGEYKPFSRRGRERVSFQFGRKYKVEDEHVLLFVGPPATDREGRPKKAGHRERRFILAMEEVDRIIEVTKAILGATCKIGDPPQATDLFPEIITLALGPEPEKKDEKSPKNEDKAEAPSAPVEEPKPVKKAKAKPKPEKKPAKGAKEEEEKSETTASPPPPAN